MRHTWKLIFAAIALLPTYIYAAAQPQAVAIPEIPDSITDIEGKRDFVMDFYLGKFNFQEPDSMLTDRGQELNFVDYIYIIGRSERPIQQKYVARLLNAAAGHSGAVESVSKLAEKYLYDSASPYLNEGLYAVIIEAEDTMSCVSQAEKMRNAYKLEQIAKCAIGSDAPDLDLAKGQTLRRLIDGVATIVLFYDHDCGTCQETIENMQNDDVLCRDLSTDSIRVVAIDMAEDRDPRDIAAVEHWISSRPASADFDLTSVYPMRGTPSLYLIDCDGTITLKDVNYQKISDEIKEGAR